MDNNKLPLVSVVTAFYNRGSYVRESILSLLNQTYPNLEIFIINDCSTDNTLEEIEKVVEGVPNVVVIDNKINKGLVRSFIDTISQSSGKYVAIHGSGDISLPTRIEKQVTFLESNTGYVVTGCNYMKEDAIGNLRNVEPQAGLDSFTILVRSGITHGEAMYRRDVYDKVGGYRSFFTYAQDRDLWCRMIQFGKFGFVDEYLYIKKYLLEGVSTNFRSTLKQRILSNYARDLYIQNLDSQHGNVTSYKDLVGDVDDIESSKFALYEIIATAKPHKNSSLRKYKIRHANADFLIKLYFVTIGIPVIRQIVFRAIYYGLKRRKVKFFKLKSRDPLQGYKILNE